MSLTVGKHTGKVLSFGELLLRICPDANGEWLNENRLPFYVGGAELNVATALSLWGLPSGYFTALPDNGMSAQLIVFLQEKGIDTSAIVKSGDRIGLYYLTQGQDLKHNALIYDRANSSFSALQTGQIDWDKLLNGVSWFHFSAICPAISQNVADVCMEALEAASKRNITISVDMNYRAKLWQYGKSPVEIMPDLVKYCHIIMGNVWAAEKMLGIPVIPDIHKSGQKSIYLRESLKTSEAIKERYRGCQAVANTFRFDATNEITYYTSLFINGQFYTSNQYDTSKVTDKVGSGDCFMAGLIYGLYKNLDPQQTLEFATAAAFEKLFINGDSTTKTVAEIENSIK
ncbi:2-dehydro-3-deoxygluconokinase [Mucilaginibacter frigoritolerans]|jgi:2-dehydro-3-deoxygluconokinase|uniref:2-dehydro-3-deoxygluconokinase n=1 Tax=Mucilaginibacter frigoritolerans TaxID=652788 RepID=A0A562TRU8_9SPHI|nr:sugar kinase [Mucilaginibacter frigoritolerans]TWI96262.1 2-dehydro-3-deoxygluconokinase [Mucilaginibacter frigoritolerans]